MAVTFFQTLKSFSVFIKRFILNGGTLVDQNTANLRAAICAGCHNNKSSGDIRKVCRVCGKLGAAAVDKFRSEVIKDNKTSSDSKILACGICGCDLKISVWIPSDVLVTKEDANAYPTFCWKKKILENVNL